MQKQKRKKISKEWRFPNRKKEEEIVAEFWNFQWRNEVWFFKFRTGHSVRYDAELPINSIQNLFAVVSVKHHQRVCDSCWGGRRRTRRRVERNSWEKKNFETENEVLIWVVIVSVERSVESDLIGRERKRDLKKEAINEVWVGVDTDSTLVEQREVG